MSNFSDFIGGGGGGGTGFPTMYFQQSMTWACPVAMEAMVYVIGGGGSGGQESFQASYSVNGGGAGGCAVSKLTLAAQDYTLVIGSGGASRSDYGTGTSYSGDGFAGGNTSMSGTGMTTMTGNGGGAGKQWNSGSGTKSVGGSATGGNLYNNTGGGSVNYSTGGVNTRGAAGGGAVGLIGDGQDGQKNTLLSGGGGLYRQIGLGGSCFGMNTLSEYMEGDSDSAVMSLRRASYKLNGKVTSDVFSGLERIIDYDFNADTGLRTVPTGASLLPEVVGGYYSCPPAGPFDGGMGFGSTGQIYGGSGTCGGGGGGINYGGGYTYNSRPGGGGAGIVIICPLSIGA